LPRSSNSVSAVQGRSSAFLAWVPPAQPLAADRRDPPVLLTLLLSAARPALAHVAKIILLNILERHMLARTVAATTASLRPPDPWEVEVLASAVCLNLNPPMSPLEPIVLPGRRPVPAAQAVHLLDAAPCERQKGFRPARKGRSAKTFRWIQA
jgi:hypothetical protein